MQHNTFPNTLVLHIPGMDGINTENTWFQFVKGKKKKKGFEKDVPLIQHKQNNST